ARIGGLMTSPRNIGRACIAIVSALLIAAVAMAFAAGKPSTKDAKTKNANTKNAKTSVSRFRALQRDRFETSLGRLSRSGEPESRRIHNGRNQEAYDDRAYPRKWIRAAQQVAAAKAANAIASLPAGLTASWKEVGPSGVPAD